MPRSCIREVGAYMLQKKLELTVQYLDLQNITILHWRVGTFVSDFTNRGDLRAEGDR